MLLHRQRAQKYLQKFDFESLFIEELGWDTVDRVTLPFEIDGHYFEVTSIAQKRGFTVFKCLTPKMPTRPVRVKLDRQLTDYSKSHLLVFGDTGKTQQIWMWVRQEPGKPLAPRFEQYQVGQSAERLLQKLEALIVDFKEEPSLTHVDVAQKVKQGFDVERVTKQFFQDFEGLHRQFCLEIEGMESESDRRWYASVLLNRLMFVYFLQRRYFLDNGDPLYLQNKLKACREQQTSFYGFLKDLFFVGFAEPEYLRDPEIQKRLGKICYLNGGLFLRHPIEQKYPDIHIGDRAFDLVFDLFSRYSWHLDDRPDKDPMEINPDVLGYIFEKYINQKEFGAYYTRPEITEYLCDRTIHKLILDRLTPLSPLGRGAGGEGNSRSGAGSEGVFQGNLLQPLAASEYQQILEDKNQSIALYKKHAFQSADPDLPQETRLLQLRDHIDKLNRESQAKLNQLLLDEFSIKLGIKYEEAQATGKPKKRVLTIADINALEPFHWGYHFDKVFAHGGFDAIITNPPWEIFKPQAKEFFAKYSDLVTKNKMDIKTFEKEQKKLLQNPEIAQAWNEYQSQFPHVSAYFRSAEDYINQISIVNGKKAGTDINFYKLFLERCYHLLRQGGECGIVIPSGIYTDLGTKQLREMLFSQTQITGLFCFENRQAIFEGVHRSFKFVVLTFEKGGSTASFPVRFMRHEVTELANFPAPDDIRLDVELIRKLSPDSLSIMEFKQPIDIAIAQKMLQFPLLGETIEGKWNLKLTREFDMTNDSHLFKTEPAPGRLPLYEGKMIHQFTHRWGQPKYWLDEIDVRNKLIKNGEADTGQILAYQMYKLGFRDIARNTDQRTAIITMLPKGVCCNHKLPTVIIYDSAQKYSYTYELFFCCVLNSFVIDYLLRQRVTTNLTFFFLYQLPVPRLQEGDKWFAEIVERAAKLICTTPEFDDLWAAVFPHPLTPSPKGGEGEPDSPLAPLSRSGAGGEGQSPSPSLGEGFRVRANEGHGVTDEGERARLRAELDGIIAHLYGLTEAEFDHILSTFPLVPAATKQAALNAYRDVERGVIP